MLRLLGKGALVIALAMGAVGFAENSDTQADPAGDEAATGSVIATGTARDIDQKPAASCHPPGRPHCPGKEIISTTDAPEAIGPYSQAVKAGNTLYLAGQIPLDPETNQVTGETIEEQTQLVMDNLTAVLEAAGMTMDNVVMANAFLADLDDFPAFNEVYGSYFTDGMPPARATVEVARLPRDVLVEVALIAVE
jgi:2-iminobutanoate/2-iminopropanoate deaminase